MLATPVPPNGTVFIVTPAVARPFASTVICAYVPAVTPVGVSVVAFPTLVTSPVKFAFVVTVAALPVVDWFSVGTSVATI
jgi:hypothetical protein